MVRKTEGYSLLLLEVLIIFLNILAIIVILRFKRKYNPDILILSLAIADLVKALIPLNMTLYAYLSEKGMTEGSVSCIIFGWTAFTLNCGIMMVMTIMAIDRYIALCWPFEYKRLLSKKRLIYTIAAVFVFSGAHSVLPWLGIGKVRPYNNGSFCHFDFDSTKPANRGYSIFVLSLGFFMIVVVVFCYTRAMVSIRGLMKRQRRMSTSTQDIDGADRKRQDMNRMFARLMIVMMMVFFVSWLLFLIVIFQHVSGWFQIPPEAHFWSMRLAVINSVLNPLISAAMCKPYRRGYLFILCKILHCCGLCSSYKADNPWVCSRRLSQGSRRSSDAEPTTPTTNQTVVKVTSCPSFSYQDSGIVPDTGSIGYHQGGIINSAYEKEQCQAGSFYHTAVDGVQERPRLHKKRISFKDEIEANQAASSPKENEVVGSVECTHDGRTHLQQEITDSLSSQQDTGQERSFTQENGRENKIIVLSKMETSSSEFENTSSFMDRQSGSSKRKQKNPVSVDPFMCKTPDLSNDDSLDYNRSSPDSKDVATTEKTKQGVKTSKTNVLMDYNQLSLSTIDVTSETLPKDFKGKNELELNPEAKVAENSDECFSTPSPLEQAGLQTLQVTHFPVTTNCDIKTTILPDCSPSGSSLPFSRSLSFLERTRSTSFIRTKLRSRSFASSSTSSTKPFYELDNLPYRTADSPLLHRHLVDLAGEQPVGIQSHSESDCTCSLPETVLISPHGTPHIGTFKSSQAVEQHDSLNNNGFSVDNGNRPQEQASNLDTVRWSSEIYKELSELSSDELEREVFC